MIRFQGSQELQKTKKDEDGKSGNIVEGLLEIVNMITDNPGLKSDLQEYFENSRKKDGKPVNSKFCHWLGGN